MKTQISLSHNKDSNMKQNAVVVFSKYKWDEHKNRQLFSLWLSLVFSLTLALNSDEMFVGCFFKLFLSVTNISSGVLRMEKAFTACGPNGKCWNDCSFIGDGVGGGVKYPCSPSDYFLRTNISYYVAVAVWQLKHQCCHSDDDSVCTFSPLPEVIKLKHDFHFRFVPPLLPLVGWLGKSGIFIYVWVCIEIWWILWLVGSISFSW